MALKNEIIGKTITVLILITAIIIAISGHAFALKSLEFSFTITNTTEIVNENFRLNEVDHPPSIQNIGNLEIIFKGPSSEKSVKKTIFFQEFDTFEPLDRVDVQANVVYKEYNAVDIYYENNLLASIEIKLCNNNGICEKNENYLSCEGDCPLNKKDGVCIDKIDGVCDPDCIKERDLDCIAEENAGEEKHVEENQNIKEKKKSSKAWIIWLVVFLILMLTIFFVVKRKKEEKQT